MLVDATQRKANIFLCPTKNQSECSVRYSLTFPTGEMIQHWMNGRDVDVVPNNISHMACFLPLSVHPLLAVLIIQG